MSTQRIFAGIAGGKKYYYGDDGELYDEAGIKQPKQYAEILKKNFTKPNPQAATPKSPKKVKPPKPPVDDDDYDDEDDDLPSKSVPRKKGPGVIRTLAKSVGEDALRSAFPEIYGLMKRYRKVYNKDRDDSTNKPKAKKNNKEAKDRKKADRKRNDKELSLKIDTIASDVRSHGELLRQQLTLQERALEFLNKISQGVKGKEDKETGIDSKLGGKAGRIKRLLRGRLLPILGGAAVLGAGAAAVYLNSDDSDTKDKPRDTEPMPNYSGVDDEKTFGSFSDPPHTTEATDEAKERQPSGGGEITVKADNLTFESRVIKFDARVVTINSVSSSSSSFAGGGAGGPGDTADATTNPFKHDGATTVPDGGGSPFETTPGGAAVGGYPRPFRKGGGDSSSSTIPGSDAAGGGGGGGGGAFNPDTITPSFEGIPGGKGATSFGKPSGETKGAPPVGPDPTGFNSKLSTGQIKEGENNPRLAEAREKLFAEVDKDPATKDLLIKGMLAEGGRKGLQANLEQVANYSLATGRTIKESLNSGFFGPITKTGKAFSIQPTDADRQQFDSALGNVRAGSNKIDYRIDQGTKGDPNYDKEQDPKYRPKVVDGSFFADHPEVGVGWADKQKKLDDQWNKEKAAAASSNKLPKVPNNMIGGEVMQSDLGTMFSKDSLSKLKPFAPAEVNPKSDASSSAEPTSDISGRGGNASVDPGLKGLNWNTNRIGLRQGNVMEPGAASAEIKPLETIKDTPGEIPDYGENDYNIKGGDEPAEKTEGNKAKVTDNARAPKQIRKIDMNKYYPQYPKSDYGDQTGIAVV